MAKSNELAQQPSYQERRQELSTLDDAEIAQFAEEYEFSIPPFNRQYARLVASGLTPKQAWGKVGHNLKAKAPTKSYTECHDTAMLILCLRELAVRELDIDITFIRSELKSLYRQSKTVQDRKTQLQVLQEMSKLNGYYPDARLQVLHNSGSLVNHEIVDADYELVQQYQALVNNAKQAEANGELIEHEDEDYEDYEDLIGELRPEDML